MTTKTMEEHTVDIDQESLPIQPLVDTGVKCAKRLVAAEDVLLVSHIDADGLTSAAVASHALERARVPFEVMFSKQLDTDDLEAISATEYDTVLFTDFGSGQLNIMQEYIDNGMFEPIICDHHEPKGDCEYHMNPLLEGLDGSSELSGAGTVYVLSRIVSQITSNTAENTPETTNKDLSAIALVGAIGDQQGGAEGVHGANEEIVTEGVEAGVIDTRKDITLYGKQTRPLHKLLEYSSEIRIPGITGSESGATKFLSDLDVELKQDGEWRYWVDLSESEKQTVISNLIEYAIDVGVPSQRIDRLIGTVYELKTEESRTALKDTSEFSTLLNATARYEREDVGLAVAMGERGEPYEEAKRLLKNHQRNISNGIDWVIENGVTHEEHVQWFDAGDEIRETIVGIIAGMALGEGNTDRDKPIIAFARKPGENGENIESEDDVEGQKQGEDETATTDDEVSDKPQTAELKVSARGNRTLTRNGLDLSVVMEEASQAVGGDGGGHDVAAGATIPENNRDEFIDVVDTKIANQLSSD